nr:M15 family metallopeptidase [uncultured Sellimonas sp.]
MKRTRKEEWKIMIYMIGKRMRKMKNPVKFYVFSCLILLVVGILGGTALGRYVENGKAEEVLQKETKKYDKLQDEMNGVQKQLEAQDEKTRPWNLMLINHSHPMEEGYVPELANIDEGHQVDKRVLKPLQEMLAAAEKEGYSLYVCSAYRSVERQKELFNESMVDYAGQGMNYYQAAVETAKSIAWPGESEHATGLAMDIVSTEYQGLDEKQGQTDDQKWLMEHCYEYGFILRYPKDKSNETGIIYEPWHYRYVGVEDAMRIKEQNVTLEQYLNEEY